MISVPAELEGKTTVIVEMPNGTVVRYEGNAHEVGMKCHREFTDYYDEGFAFSKVDFAEYILTVRAHQFKVTITDPPKKNFFARIFKR